MTRLRRAVKRAEVIAKATFDLHAGRITHPQWRAVLRQFRR